MARSSLKQKSLWQVSVVTSLEAEDAVIELLARVFNRAASVYTNAETCITVASVVAERYVSIRRGPPGWSFLPVPTVEQGGIVFIHLDQLDEVFDAEVGGP